MIIIIDPGHGMSNRKRGVYDPGAVAGEATEAGIAMEWANELRGILLEQGHRVVRTRVDENDPCPVSRRDDIAASYKGDRMISLHLNAANGSATGTEVFYRGSDDRQMAAELSSAVAGVLGINDRGPKTEKQSQHTALAVLEFDKCWLLEIGFIDNSFDRARALNPEVRKKACQEIARIITS